MRAIKIIFNFLSLVVFIYPSLSYSCKIELKDLVLKSENEMLRTPNFGRKSLNEIREVLSQMGLGLGMSIEEWPPENIETLAKQIEDPY